MGSDFALNLIGPATASILAAIPNIEQNFTKVVYVKATGTNTDGLTWTKAFTSFAGALTAIGATDYGLIVIDGAIDVNVAGIVNVNKKVLIVGTSILGASITNSNGAATGVLDFTVAGSGLANITIISQTVAGNTLIGTALINIANIYLNCSGIVAGVSGITLDAVGSTVSNVIIRGTANLTAIKANVEAYVKNIEITSAAIGLSLPAGASNRGHYMNFSMTLVTTGISITSGGFANIFENFNINCIANNILVTGAIAVNSYLKIQISNEQTLILPAVPAGVAIPQNAAANLYGVLTPVVAAGGFGANKPYKIKGIFFDTVLAAVIPRFQVCDAGGNVIFEVAGQAGTLQSFYPSNNDQIQMANSGVSVRGMDDVGGVANLALVHVQYEVY